MRENLVGQRTSARGAALKKLMILALLIPLFPRGLAAERVQITATFELPCEFAWRGGSVIVYYRNAATYTAVVDRVVKPRLIETFENDVFRFVLYVDMRGNKVIATTYDKDSGNTVQMETSLDALCKVPMRGAEYIPLLSRPQIWIRKADLRLDDASSTAGIEYRAIMADLGLTQEALPESFRVVRQGLSIRVTAEPLLKDLVAPTEAARRSP